MLTRITQKYFKDKENGKIVAFALVELITEEFGAIQLQVKKEDKKIFNFECKKMGFVIGEVTEIPERKVVEI